jgi:hypothetical protein
MVKLNETKLIADHSHTVRTASVQHNGFCSKIRRNKSCLFAKLKLLKLQQGGYARVFVEERDQLLQ